MDAPRRRALSYLVLLSLALAALFVSGFQTSPDRPAMARGGAVLPDLAGVWTGTWEDTLYFVGGDLSFEITATEGGYLATGEIDLGALGLGTRSGEADGLINGNQLDFGFTADQVGEGAGILTDESASGSGNVTSPLDFGNFSFTGMATEIGIWGTFDFTAPTGGAGKAHLTRTTATEASSLSAVKAHYGGE
jgi:hypothetical protein